MSGIIVTLVLISFVIGGGLYIFWPDLRSVITKPKKEKKKKQAYLNVEAVYRAHYSEEDELIEAVSYAKRHYDAFTITEALARIQKRGDKIKIMLSNESTIQHCNMCNESNTTSSHYGNISIRCSCDGARFKQRIMKMLKDTGHTQ